MYLMLCYVWSRYFIHFNAFKTAFLTIKWDGISFMLLLTLFRAAIRMKLSLVYLQFALVFIIWPCVEVWYAHYVYCDTFINVFCLCSSNYSRHHYSAHKHYKTSVSHYTTIDVSFLILLSVFYTSLLGNNITASNGQKYLYIFNALATVSCVIPIIYITSIVLHWTFSRRKWGRALWMKVGVFLKGSSNYRLQLGDSSMQCMG